MNLLCFKLAFMLRLALSTPIITSKFVLYASLFLLSHHKLYYLRFLNLVNTFNKNLLFTMLHKSIPLYVNNHKFLMNLCVTLQHKTAFKSNKFAWFTSTNAVLSENVTNPDTNKRNGEEKVAARYSYSSRKMAEVWMSWWKNQGGTRKFEMTNPRSDIKQ